MFGKPNFISNFIFRKSYNYLKYEFTMIKYIVFDFDGTLADTFEIVKVLIKSEFEDASDKDFELFKEPLLIKFPDSSASLTADEISLKISFSLDILTSLFAG